MPQLEEAHAQQEDPAQPKKKDFFIFLKNMGCMLEQSQNYIDKTEIGKVVETVGKEGSGDCGRGKTSLEEARSCGS